MRLTAQILTLGILFWGIRAIAQDNNPGTASNAEYREKLRALSAEQQNTKPDDSSNESRDAYYKEKLKRLADDDGAKAAAARGSSSAEIPDTEVIQPGTKPKAEIPASKPVALNGSSVPNQSALSDSQQSAGQAPAAECDEYCQQLRRTAEAHDSSRRHVQAQKEPSLTTERNFVKNLAFDQMHIWASPFKLRDSDSTWAVPFGIVTGSLIATDRDLSKQAATPSRLDKSKQISDAGLYSFIGAGAGLYGVGLLTHDNHKRETGLLSGEAFVDATLVAEALKVVVGRQRPIEGDHFGHIGRGGSSFPSEHAIGSFAIATVIAQEYPNPFVQIGAYGLAATVAAARVTAGQHFPSDVLVGGAFGYLIGRKIFNDHHNPELGGAEYGTFIRERKLDAEHSGSTYVPLESWVYPVIDRLAALGVVHSNFDSERPFTRLECARIATEAAQGTTFRDQPADVREMVDSLLKEFSRESEVWVGDADNRSAEIESIYTRVVEISGPVLRDGYHFGQTLYNDYGRPYGRGFNNVTGLSARATSGPLIVYFRGEYQRAPGNPDYSPQVKAQLSAADQGTPQVDTPFPAQDRFRVLDAYVGLNFNNNQLSIGQQSLWWGPGTGGPFMFTNNAEPLKMIRLNRVSPMEIPLLSKFLGPLRYDMFLGQTDGYHYLLAPKGLLGPHLGTQPFVQGQRFTFKPTPNFEFGFTHTNVFGGSGYPLTADYLFRATFSTATTGAGAVSKPGDRRSGFDITYRVPKFRDWLTWYADQFSEDEVSPVVFPRSSAMRSGIYAARLPGLRRVDLRVEGVYTDIPSFGSTGGIESRRGYFYFNATYKDGFTTDGDIMGSWLGRDGRGINASSTIWLSAENSIQLGYREGVVDKEFLLGGHYQDFTVNLNYDLRKDLAVSTMLQYEHWKFPLLASLPQVNVSSVVQVTYRPSWKSPREGLKLKRMPQTGNRP